MRAAVLIAAGLASAPPAVTQGRARVLIDPSHGWRPAVEERLVAEGRITLEVALSLASALRAAGAEVLLTRGDSIDVPAIDRIGLARAFRPTFVIVLHQDPPELMHEFAGKILGDFDDPAVQAAAGGIERALEDALGGRIERVSGRFISVRQYGSAGVVIKLGQQGIPLPGADARGGFAEAVARALVRE